MKKIMTTFIIGYLPIVREVEMVEVNVRREATQCLTVIITVIKLRSSKLYLVARTLMLLPERQSH